MSIDDCLKELTRNGVELHLWLGEVRFSGPTTFPLELQRAFEEYKPQILGMLVREHEKERLRGDRHDWAYFKAPGGKQYVSCGSHAWCQRLMRSVQLFATRTAVRRWVVLESEHVKVERVNGLVKGEIVGWPAGYGAHPSDKNLDVLAACSACLPAPPYAG